MRSAVTGQGDPEVLRLIGHFDDVHNMPLGDVWAHFHGMRFAQASDLARRQFEFDPFHSWLICGMWSAQMANDKTRLEELRKRARTALRFAGCGLWLLTEMEKLTVPLPHRSRVR
jgi:hypothetical protein